MVLPALTRPSLALLAALALAGCPAGPAPVVQAPAVPPLVAPSGTAIQGLVVAPLGIVAAGGGNIVAGGGGNIVAAGGGNLISKGGAGFGPAFHLAAAAESPLAGAVVTLADAAGNPFPAVPPVLTDAAGRYHFPGVPADFTYVVNVAVLSGNKPASLQTLTRPGALGATADVSGASTCVTIAVVEGKDGVLGEVNPLVFQRAVTATSQNLTAETWPDFADRKAIIKTMGELATRVVELKDAMDQLRQEISKLANSIDQLSKTVEELRKQGAATPVPPVAQPTAAAVPTATPVPGPVGTSTPSPAEVQTGTPVPEATPRTNPEPTAAATPVTEASASAVLDVQEKLYTFEIEMSLFSPVDHRTPIANTGLRVAAAWSGTRNIAPEAVWYSDAAGNVKARLVAKPPQPGNGASAARQYDILLKTADGDKPIGYFDIDENNGDFMLAYQYEAQGPTFAHVPAPRITKLR